jgi:hypothetical protein
MFRQWFAPGGHRLEITCRQSAELHEFQVLNMAVNPAFAAMRNDPPFRALALRIGL